MAGQTSQDFEWFLRSLDESVLPAQQVNPAWTLDHIVHESTRAIAPQMSDEALILALDHLESRALSRGYSTYRQAASIIRVEQERRVKREQRKTYILAEWTLFLAFLAVFVPVLIELFG